MRGLATDGVRMSTDQNDILGGAGALAEVVAFDGVVGRAEQDGDEKASPWGIPGASRFGPRVRASSASESGSPKPRYPPFRFARFNAFPLPSPAALRGGRRGGAALSDELAGFLGKLRKDSREL